MVQNAGWLSLFTGQSVPAPMPLNVSSTLIAAQAQSYVAPSKKDGSPRSFAPPPVEKLADRGNENAVRVEISAEAKRAEQSRLETRDADRRADDRVHARVDDQRAADRRSVDREFSREAPLRDAQQNAGTRNTRPGTNLDISI